MGDEGARALSEALKVNTTLTSLNLESAQQQEQDKDEQMHELSHNIKTGNKISDEGAFALSETLKVNTTLTTLKLGGVQKQKTK